MLLERLVSQAELALAPEGYRLSEIVGVGGMGVVYALDPSTTSTNWCDLVVKMVHPCLANSAKAELQLCHEASIELALQGLPHVVQTLSYGVHSKGQGYKIMRRKHGESLRTWLRSTRQALEIDKVLQGLASVLQSIHTQGVVHGDLKPSNIFIARESADLTLFDFGLARHLSRDFAIRSGFRAYSPYYSSPAVLAGQAPEIADDDYSFKVIARECRGRESA